MKKIIVIGFVILAIFIIYLSNLDKKVYYLALGDSLVSENFDGNLDLGYFSYVSDYLKGQEKLEKEVFGYLKDDYRATDVINDIEENEKLKIDDQKITIKNALIKADLITLTVGNADFLKRVLTKSYSELYDYIDQASKDLDKLLKLIREYCKEDIILIGYYMPLKTIDDEDLMDYLNRKFENICDNYDVEYIRIDSLFIDDAILDADNIHPSTEGNKLIADEVITVIDNTLFK